MKAEIIAEAYVRITAACARLVADRRRVTRGIPGGCRAVGIIACHYVPLWTMVR